MADINFASLERKNIIAVLIALVLLGYGFKLFHMQIISNQIFDDKSTGNSIKSIQQIPLRGVFYDRNLKLLVENIPAYTVRILPSDYDTTKNALLEAVMDLQRGTIGTLLLAHLKKFNNNIPLSVKRGVDFSVIGWIDENAENLSGVDYAIELQRSYPTDISGSHIFGYAKEIDQSRLNADKDNFYTQGDVIGYSGLEKYYEKVLRGEKGFNYILVDSRRREIGKFRDGQNDKPSVKGKDLVLGIDAELQKTAENALRGKTGAIVAIEPKTGEILAMASSPDFDLKRFSYITQKSYLDSLYKNKKTPMFNRATMSIYPPGSTFKVMAAIAALELGAIDENTTLFCGGAFNFGRVFACHGAHGHINVIHALEASCNTFFYQLIFKIGLDRLAEYCKRYGLGTKIGIDLPEESSGIIPTTSFYEKAYGKDWPQGILVSLGIGQGEISATPLQLAHLAALVANKGKSFRPHLVRGFLDEHKQLELLPFPIEDMQASQKTMEIVTKGMFLAVNGPGGTANNIAIPELQICGKTGTAQNPHGDNHAWFIGFAPEKEPQIAVSVIIENAGWGASNAAPVAQLMIATFLKYQPKKTEELQTQTKPEEQAQEEVLIEDKTLIDPEHSQ